MWWLTRAMVAPSLPLAHALGVRQSTAPSNLVRKLIHAGTDDVAVGMALMPAARAQRLHETIATYRIILGRYRGHPSYARNVPLYEGAIVYLERQIRLVSQGFEALSDEELMGPPPAGGAYEAVKK
jgi:hypothetical protein